MPAIEDDSFMIRMRDAPANIHCHVALHGTPAPLSCARLRLHDLLIHCGRNAGWVAAANHHSLTTVAVQELAHMRLAAPTTADRLIFVNQALIHTDTRIRNK